MTATAFVFPGPCAQHVGMGRAVLAERPDLAQTYCRTADQHLGIPLSRLCLDGPARDLDDPAVTQPATLLTSLITLELLRGKGVEPDVVAGHSLGEYTALVAAGVLHWTDALWLVRLCGELVASVGDRVRGGAAAVLGLPRAEVERLCAATAAATGRTVEVGGDHGPDHTVVSGEAEAVAHLKDAALAAGATRVAGLNTGGPLHSSLLRPIEAEFTEALTAIEFRDPRIPLVSSITGTRLTTAAEVVGALREQLTQQVRWSAAVRLLADTGTERFVETGPGLVLGGLIRRILPGAGVHATGDARQLALTTDALTPAATAA